MADLNIVKLENDQSSSSPSKIRNKLSTTHYSRRCIANNFEVDDFVDLTEDNRCFICDKVLSSCSYYALTSAQTNTSKAYIAQKLGEVIGNGYIVLISDDDYICQTCLNLFNKLDNTEIQLQLARANIIEHIQQKYGHQVNKANRVPGHLYKALQIMVDKENKINEPPKKKSCFKTNNILKEVEALNCDSHQFQCKELTSTERIVQSCIRNHKQSLIPEYKYQTVKSIKENMIQTQDKGFKNLNLSSISSPIHSSIYKKDVIHTIESIKVEHQIDTCLAEYQRVFTENNVCSKTNLTSTEWNFNNSI